MGQQQLLLLVLGIVIVGLAVVTGLQLFDENRGKAAADEMIAVGARIASEGTAWVLQPSQVGGGGNDPSGIEFTRMGYAAEDDGSYTTGDAAYTMVADADGFVITGTDNQARAVSVTAVYGSGTNCLALVQSKGTDVPETPAVPADCGGW